MLTEVGSFDFYKVLSDYGLVEKQKHKKKSQQKHEIINAFCAFDIETSTIWLNDDHSLYDVHSFMYVWQFQIEEYTFKGRTWDEFFSMLKIIEQAIIKIREDQHLSVNPLLIIWVHNLAYEFSFLSGFYPFRNDECFFRDARKPIYCRMFDTFEYRCSYIQSNLSLSALCKQTGVPEKLSGQKFDYDKIRFPWTPLSTFEEEYCTRDVESLVQAMKYRVQRGGDTLATVPITSTGYVRRECKEALKDYYLDMRELKPSEKEYRLLRKAFRGGNTHANRYFVDKIVEDVYSYDISSSYPTQQLTKPFPIKAFKWIMLDQRTAEKRMKRVMMFIGLGYAVVGTYQFKGLRLKNHREPIPYISLSRCQAMGFLLDNGRILEADYVEISLTEIDLEIILDQYTFDEMDVIECMVAVKDMLPESYRRVIQEYYNKKTSLKGDNTEDGKYMYVKSKNMLNSVYGMSATDPIHQEIKYDGGYYSRSSYETMTNEEIEKALKNASFPYQWGVYTTAYARKQLQDAIKLCGDRIVYCDTDSVKTIREINIGVLNTKLKKIAISNKAYADDMNGQRHYIGLFEDDGHYDQFITQGAKRYAYLIGDKMGITVAGVSKKINEDTGISFAVEELQSLERFRPGMVWSKAGGTISVYNDVDNIKYTDPITGKCIEITKNVAIVPSTYEMSYSKDYCKLLNEIQLYGDYQRERE
ncbi:MAG: hypothetical protein J6S67_00855 [Methanobrevibacter sp.]|nr:hypothetical protein [Methanobrevibacter sp.]